MCEHDHEGRVAYVSGTDNRDRRLICARNSRPEILPECPVFNPKRPLNVELRRLCGFWRKRLERKVKC
jgi:hypothetical protein